MAPKEALQVARGSIPVDARREWTGGRKDDLAHYVVSRTGFGMLDLVRVGFAGRMAQDPLAFHAAVDAFAAREARAARGGVMAFLEALCNSGAGIGEGDELPKRLWTVMAEAAALVGGAKGRNPGLDEVLDALGVSEREFELAAGGVGPVCPIAVDPFSYKVVVRSVFFKNAMAAAAGGRPQIAEAALGGEANRPPAS